MCVRSCDKIFEVKDDQNTNKCKKCDSDSFFSKGSCKQIEKTVEGQKEFKKDLLS